VLYNQILIGLNNKNGNAGRLGVKSRSNLFPFNSFVSFVEFNLD